MSRGHELVAIDSFDSTLYGEELKRARARQLQERAGLEILDCDIASPEVGDYLAGVEVIVNEAAVPGLGPSWLYPSEYFKSNSIGVANLLSHIQNTGIHFVQASTSSVYGLDASGDEQKICQPASPYGASKLAAENLIRGYAENFNASFTILRYFSVFGPNQRPDMAYSIFCSRLLANKPILLNGDGTQLRNNTYITDIVEATVLAAEAEPENQTFNVCGEEETSILEAITVLADELGVEPRIEHRPRVSGDQLRTKGDSKKIRGVLGWAPEIGLEAGLRMQARQALLTRNQA